MLDGEVNLALNIVFAMFVLSSIPNLGLFFAVPWLEEEGWVASQEREDENRRAKDEGRKPTHLVGPWVTKNFQKLALLWLLSSLIINLALGLTRFEEAKVLKQWLVGHPMAARFWCSVFISLFPAIHLAGICVYCCAIRRSIEAGKFPRGFVSGPTSSLVPNFFFGGFCLAPCVKFVGCEFFRLWPDNMSTYLLIYVLCVAYGPLYVLLTRRMIDRTVRRSNFSQSGAPESA